jgi:hypothetical protein
LLQNPNKLKPDGHKSGGIIQGRLLKMGSLAHDGGGDMTLMSCEECHIKFCAPFSILIYVSETES